MTSLTRNPTNLRQNCWIGRTLSSRPVVTQTNIAQRYPKVLKNFIGRCKTPPEPPVLKRYHEFFPHHSRRNSSPHQNLFRITQIYIEMNLFQRYLSLWFFCCIISGIALGHELPLKFELLSRIELAKVNLPSAALIWLMVTLMLLKIDFTALTGVGNH